MRAENGLALGRPDEGVVEQGGREDGGAGLGHLHFVVGRSRAAPLKEIPKSYRKPIGAMVTGRGYDYRPGPEITRGYISGRPWPKYYF